MWCFTIRFAEHALPWLSPLATREQELGVLRDTVPGNFQEIARLTGQLTEEQVAVDERAPAQREAVSVELLASDRNHEVATLLPLPEPQDGRLAKAEQDPVASMQPEIVKGMSLSSSSVITWLLPCRRACSLCSARIR